MLKSKKHAQFIIATAENIMSAPEIPMLFEDAPLRELVLPFERQRLSLLVLQNARALHSSIDPACDVYWGELWPAAVALADAVFSDAIPLPKNGDPVLELGCGTGLVSVALALRGASVVATDREFRALRLTEENARRNGVSEKLSTARIDWKEPHATKHALIIAGDCLYHADSCWQLAAFLRNTLAGPHARAYVVDPDRWCARNFGFQAQEAGLSVKTFRRRVPFMREDGPVREIFSSAPSSPEIEATFYELALSE
jgi:predicted nicotinamide N-methyase